MATETRLARCAGQTAAIRTITGTSGARIADTSGATTGTAASSSAPGRIAPSAEPKPTRLRRLVLYVVQERLDRLVACKRDPVMEPSVERSEKSSRVAYRKL